MANDNIKRYLDYDGLAYLINKFNSVIEANEYTTSEALNDLNRKIAEININDNTGGFPIIDADITQVDSIYTTTENLNELITPGQYIVDSSKIQYEEDNFVKTLYWLLSVDKVVYDNSESIIQTYYPLSYLSYNWYNIPVGGLLQRFYEGNNTWTDLQVAAPGDVDPSKFVTKNEFDTNINTINTSITTINTSINNINTSITNVNEEIVDINEEIVDINETIKGLSKTDNDTKCETGTINADTEAEDPTSDVVSVLKNQDIPLSGDGTYLSGNATAVNVVTKQYVDQNFIPKSESDSIWKAINDGIVHSISLEKSGIRKAIADEEVEIPYINNKISFTERPTGSFTGKFDVISLPTKNYVINNYVSNQTLSTTLNDYVSNQTLSTILTNYVDKDSVIPNILKNGTPLGINDTLQWFKTSNAITDTNSTDYNDICAPSYSDFDETTALHNKNSMVIRSFWTSSYFHDIWTSPNTDHIFHRSINNGVAKPWKILLDNENCGKYIKNVVDSTYVKNIVDSTYVKNIVNNTYINQEIGNNIIDIANFKTINIPLSTKAGIEIPDGKAIIGTNILDLSTVLDREVRNIHSKSTDINYNEYTDLSIILNNSINKRNENQNLYSLSESLSIGYYDVSKNKNIRIGSFYTYDCTGRAQGRFDLDGELCVHDDDNKAYLIFEHNNVSATANSIDPRSTGRHIKRDENNKIIEDISFNSLFSVNSERQIFVTDHFSIKDRNYNSDKQDNFSDPYEYSNLFIITDSSANFYVPLYVNNSQVLTSSNISSNLPSTVITTSNISNYSTKSSEYIKIDSVNNISEYNNCAYFLAGNSTNINEGTGPEPNKIYQPKHVALNDFINGTASGNPVSAFVSDMRWTSTLRLFFNSKYFYDVQFDPNNENIIHRLVCNGTSKPWHLLLDSNNYNDFFKISHLTPKSLNVTNNINVGGGVYETSDETLKDFQDSIQVNFEQLKEIPKAYFAFKDDKTGETKIGTSAQKVKEFYPELVSEDENGILSVDYAKLSIVALKAVDDLDDRISKLEKLVEQLINNK